MIKELSSCAPIQASQNPKDGDGKEGRREGGREGAVQFVCTMF
jgi:hypothetical protein